MTLQQLEYILAVNQFRHFAKAAEYCRITQPTLSAMIQKLEEENGKNAEDVFKELTTKDGKPIENILVDEKKAPSTNIPSFTTKFNSGEQKKGTQKLREMSLDDRMKLKAEDPDYYATLLNDR